MGNQTAKSGQISNPQRIFDDNLPHLDGTLRTRRRLDDDRKISVEILPIYSGDKMDLLEARGQQVLVDAIDKTNHS